MRTTIRLFERLCRESGAKGNLVADAYLAALAIESGAEWVTMDRDYSRFRGLRSRSPIDRSRPKLFSASSERYSRSTSSTRRSTE